MVAVKFRSIEVDRCTGCQGLFFDQFEKEKLLALKGADAIDTGDVELGRALNPVDRINCPRCETRMIRTVDIGQPHIWFERCQDCGGSFFDAGEFKDLKHHTILDIFRDFAAKKRTQSVTFANEPLRRCRCTANSRRI